MPHPWKGRAWRVQNGMMFLRPDAGGPAPGPVMGRADLWVLLRSTSSLERWRVDPSVDISWILEAPSPYDRSGIVSRYGPTVSV
jgi:hypothetical protein